MIGQVCNYFGRLFGLLRQLPGFASHHGKTFSPDSGLAASIEALSAKWLVLSAISVIIEIISLISPEFRLISLMIPYYMQYL